MRDFASTERRMAALEEEVRSVLEHLLAQVRQGDWNAASRRALDLVHAAHRVQTEVDFQSMHQWLDKAKAA